MKLPTNYHHLRPKTRGGLKIESNMLLIKICRHNAWHRMFHCLTLNEVIRYLKKSSLKTFKKSNDWTILFGSKDPIEVIDLLERVRKAKRNQSLYLLLN